MAKYFIFLLFNVCFNFAQTNTGEYKVMFTEENQIILGIGYEIQSDSIGSGNHGLPESNSSVPNDLVPSEKTRFYHETLSGFRYCRLALGLYFRGLTEDQKHIVERWPGQAKDLAEMAKESGIEGFAPEYWSPAPGWKSTKNYINGTLASFDASFLQEFGQALVSDVKYLEENGMPVPWWGLQNEPPEGPSGCIYSCCGYNDNQYYETFKVVAPMIKAAFPNIKIHANSWGGQHSAVSVAKDPETAKYVDVWTYHHVGSDSDDQIDNQQYFLSGDLDKPVANNEFEYLSGPTSPTRCLNTAQSIMNWFTFENSPFWYWLHVLKPTTNSESSGYGLGYWRPYNDSDFSPNHFPNLQYGHYQYNPDNWNAVSGFTRYMPWNSVRVTVVEDTVRKDNRILAYKFNPALARWRNTHKEVNDVWKLIEHYSEDSFRASATKLGVVVSNRISTNAEFNAVISISGVTDPTADHEFSGYQYGPNDNNTPLGTKKATNIGDILSFNVTLPALTIQFWVEN